MKFCTYFDHNYLPKGLALYQSLKNHLCDFTLFVLCLSQEALDALEEMALPEVVTIPLEDLEKWDPELLAVKSTRSQIEYYFTLSPVLPLYIFNHFPDIDWLHYLDSDLYFFQSPELLLPELEGKHCGITPHDFSLSNRNLEWYGRYNVGLVSWRNTPQGKSILYWYRVRCIEWCYDYGDGTRFADQKYLDSFYVLFDGVHAFSHKGVNVAPWNINNRRWDYSNDTLFVNEVPLIFYHFHGLKEIEQGLYNPSVMDFGGHLNDLTRNNLYLPYLALLKEKRAQVEPYLTDANLSGIRYTKVPEDIRDRLFRSGTQIEFS